MFDVAFFRPLHQRVHMFYGRFYWHTDAALPQRRFTTHRRAVRSWCPPAFRRRTPRACALNQSPLVASRRTRPCRCPCLLAPLGFRPARQPVLSAVIGVPRLQIARHDEALDLFAQPYRRRVHPCLHGEYPVDSLHGDPLLVAWIPVHAVPYRREHVPVRVP